MTKTIESWKKNQPDAFDSISVEKIRIDTVIQEVEVEGALRIDTLLTEKLVREYIKDTVLITEFIDRFLDVTRDSIATDTLGIVLRIAGTNVDYFVRKDSAYIMAEKEVEKIYITETEVVVRRFWKDWVFWLIIIGIVVVFVFRDVLIAAIRTGFSKLP